MQHTFHIPVMGLAFTIDTPIKVARFGISSVVSIVDDLLIEEMRKFYTEKMGGRYIPILQKEPDSRARRITAYLNILNKIVGEQVKQLRSGSFETDSELDTCFELLPGTSPLRKAYMDMLNSNGEERVVLEESLKRSVTAGSIDVNIMTKLDKQNYSKDGVLLPQEYSDAQSALRGFALSDLHAAVVLSAGLNPKLYSYFEVFDDFFPDESGRLIKKIILKVSDYRSAIIQGRFLAKKGLWVSEFRIESGLNCGGHAFINDGVLLGPIMQTFKDGRKQLYEELLTACNSALAQKGRHAFTGLPEQKITVQGGIGTANEANFMLDYYQVDSVGWGSPFLLVPEVTNVDTDTLNQLINAQPEDYYISDASPLGVPFHNFRNSSSEKQRVDRIERNRPGSPCHKKFLSFNNEFTAQPICTASRQFQQAKLIQLEAGKGVRGSQQIQEERSRILVKECLCEGLAVTALLNNGIDPKHQLKAVSICPGPNLAYFTRIASMKEMVNHIYGRADLLAEVFRPNVFVNEIRLYIDYLKKEMEKQACTLTEKKHVYFQTFRDNLINGIRYYETIFPQMQQYPTLNLIHMRLAMQAAERELSILRT